MHNLFYMNMFLLLNSFLFVIYRIRLAMWASNDFLPGLKGVGWKTAVKLHNTYEHTEEESNKTKYLLSEVMKRNIKNVVFEEEMLEECDLEDDADVDETASDLEANRRADMATYADQIRGNWCLKKQVGCPTC